MLWKQLDDQSLDVSESFVYFPLFESVRLTAGLKIPKALMLFETIFSALHNPKGAPWPDAYEGEQT